LYLWCTYQRVIFYCNFNLFWVWHFNFNKNNTHSTHTHTSIELKKQIKKNKEGHLSSKWDTNSPFSNKEKLYTEIILLPYLVFWKVSEEADKIYYLVPLKSVWRSGQNMAWHHCCDSDVDEPQPEFIIQFHLFCTKWVLYA
jgi:glycopeptide antibiotics resistance protein